MSALPKVCPKCGTKTHNGFGLAGGGYGEYVTCTADACDYFEKRQDTGHTEAELCLTDMPESVKKLVQLPLATPGTSGLNPHMPMSTVNPMRFERKVVPGPKPGEIIHRTLGLGVICGAISSPGIPMWQTEKLEKVTCELCEACSGCNHPLHDGRTCGYAIDANTTTCLCTCYVVTCHQSEPSHCQTGPTVGTACLYESNGFCFDHCIHCGAPK